MTARAAGPYVQVVGVAQDAGHPQAGCELACCAAAWADAEKGHLPASLAIFDPGSSSRWLIDATPDIAKQLHRMGRAAAGHQPVDGILLTHAHIGHYTGLMHVGHEVMGADRIPVWAMPRMASFLTTNGPWEQLVQKSNIDLRVLSDEGWVALSPRVRFQAFTVPHRDEYSETVGYIIEGPKRRIAWIPDIDKWGRWSRRLEELLSEVDVAWVDGTFYADGELGNRDMSKVPHPFVVETMERLAEQSAEVKQKLRFVHLNHTNPLLNPTSAEHAQVLRAGFRVAKEGERVALD
jgi:pyrroloquinoline quinone biosynthesis protein B